MRSNVDAAIDGPSVRGTFKGTTVDNVSVAGVVAGEIRGPTPIPPDAKLWVKLEDGYVGGAMWQNRVFFKWKHSGGKFASGTADNNKGVFKAKLDDASVLFDGAALKGEVRSTGLESANVKHGAYRFERKGVRVGNVLYGRFYTHHGGKLAHSGYFVGGIAP